jgi:hypothetical protein
MKSAPTQDRKMQDHDRMRPFCVRPGSFCDASKAQQEVF